MIKIETPRLSNRNQSITNQVQIPNKNQPKNKEEEKKEEKEISKVEENKEKEISPEEKKKNDINKKTLNLFKNILTAPRNQSTLQEIYESLQTNKNFEMSTLKNPPNFSDERVYIENQKENKKVKHVNYPLSAIGLLKCDYGNDLVIYGTGTLIGLNMVLTCAHILYSPVLKRRCNNATFYLNLFKGKCLDESEVETFAIPDEYELSSNEQYDYALCILKEDLAKKGGYLGICIYDEKEDKNGYIYGYSNIKSTRNFVSSFKTKMDEYEIMGVKTSIRFIEEDKNLIYVGNKTKEGQDGSPVFKIIMI